MEKKLSVLAKKYAALDDRSFSNYVERAVARQVEEDQRSEGSTPAAAAAAPKAAPAAKTAVKAKAPASKKTARR